MEAARSEIDRCVLAYSVNCIKLVNDIGIKGHRGVRIVRHRPIKTLSNLSFERDSHCIGQL